MTREELQWSIIELLTRDREKKFWAAHTSEDILQLIDLWTEFVLGKPSSIRTADATDVLTSAMDDGYDLARKEIMERAGLSTKGGKELYTSDEARGAFIVAGKDPDSGMEYLDGLDVDGKYHMEDIKRFIDK